MRLTPIVEQLKAAGFARVEGALEFAGLKQAPRGQSLYVVPESEEAKPNSLVGQPGAIDQAVAERFMVVVVLEAVARNPDRISEDLHNFKTRVRDALGGWTHPDGSRPVEWAGGGLLSADGQALAWAVRFRSGSRFRKVG